MLERVGDNGIVKRAGDTGGGDSGGIIDQGVIVSLTPVRVSERPQSQRSQYSILNAAEK